MLGDIKISRKMAKKQSNSKKIVACAFATVNSGRPYGSYGNGSAMRVSSPGWLYDTLEQTAAECRKRLPGDMLAVLDRFLEYRTD